MNEQAVSRAEFEELRHRVEAAESRLHDGDISLALLKQEFKQINNKLDEMAMTLQELSLKPARRWDSISQQILTWIVTALLAYIAVKIGLK